jgi:DNA-binding NtrC family response regulator
VDRSVLLVDLESPYDTALAARCSGAKMRPLPVRGDLSEVSGARDLVLCVAAISGRQESAIERVRALVKTLRAVPVVVLANDIGIDIAIRLIRMGVADVIELSGAPMEVAARAFNSLRSELEGSEVRLDFVGQSPEMTRLRERIANAGRVASTVLIQGETGTGKGVIARLIHESSDRRERPFVHVDCGALAPNLIESELFGHERGAFTGAAAQRRGRFETAEMGTVFLDEIGELQLHLQAKLLRVLEERTFERVGGSSPLRLRARVIAATNRNLRAGVRAGTFRTDLYFRLNVLAIDVPSLRERASDIPLLVDAGLRRICEVHGIPVPRVSDAVLETLSEQRWPGNIRELMNLLERLAVEDRDALTDEDQLEQFLRPAESLEPVTHRSPPQAPASPSGNPEHDPLSDLDPSEFEDAQEIRNALVEAGGNLSRTARRLEIPRSTLRHRIVKYQLGHLVPKD